MTHLKKENRRIDGIEIETQKKLQDQDRTINEQRKTIDILNDQHSKTSLKVDELNSQARHDTDQLRVRVMEELRKLDNTVSDLP